MKNLVCCLLISLSLPAFAADLDVKSPWTRSTVQGQPATGAFMDLSSSTGVTLLSASSPVAAVVEIHEMKMDNGIMKMRAVQQIDIPSGQTVQLAPGGYHIMLMNLKSVLKPGDTVPVVLSFKDKTGKKQKITVKTEVRDMTAPAALPDDHAKMHEAMHEHMHGDHK